MIHYLIPFPFLMWGLCTDIRTRRITNWNTYTLILLGLAFQVHSSGVTALAGGFAGVFLYLLLSTRLRTMRVGGGDLKLMAGCLMFLNIRAAELFIVLIFFISALMAMVQYARLHGSGNLIQLLKLDLLTAGTAAQEQVHVTGALVILMAYSLAVSYTLGMM